MSESKYKDARETFFRCLPGCFYMGFDLDVLIRQTYL